MKKDDGGPAFPQVETEREYELSFDEHWPRTYSYGGMALRDYFAGQALIGLASSTFNDAEHVEAALAYKLADAMLAERSKP